MKRLKTALMLLANISLISAMEPIDETRNIVIGKYGWGIEAAERMRDGIFECTTYDSFKEKNNLRRDRNYCYQDECFEHYLYNEIKGTVYKKSEIHLIPNSIKSHCVRKALEYQRTRFLNMLRSTCYRDGVPHQFLGQYLAEEAFMFEYEDRLTSKYILERKK